MIIRRIRLVNFRKYSELELEFPEGLIGIVGRNGAGKTTILEAVGFALYGASASRSKGKGIRRDGCSQNENCVVELDFALGGNSYSIVRELRGTNELQTAKMYTGDEELIAHQARGIEAKARQLLGLDYQTFIRSIFARQKELALLSDERPEERQHDSAHDGNRANRTCIQTGTRRQTCQRGIHQGSTDYCRRSGS